MDRSIEMIMDMVDSMLTPDMKDKEKIDFLTVLENRIWELREAMVDDMRKQ